MKIEIDLNEILGNEFGTESLNESITRQVIENITKKIQGGIEKEVSMSISNYINSEIKRIFKDYAPTIVDDLLSYEYTRVDRFGQKAGEPTTFKKELVNTLMEQMVYRKNQNYQDDRNYFTKAVDNLVVEQLKTFKQDFDKSVNENFAKDALDYATEKLKKKLGL